MIPDCITEDHLRWAADQGCAITAGEAGFGRPCVGLLKNGHWVDYSSWDYGNYPDYEMKKIEGAYDEWIPADAYHKHECVAVLGQDNGAWQQLALWLDVIISGNWEVYDKERKADLTNPLDLMFHGTHTPTLRKKGNNGQEAATTSVPSV